MLYDIAIQKGIIYNPSRTMTQVRLHNMSDPNRIKIPDIDLNGALSEFPNSPAHNVERIRINMKRMLIKSQIRLLGSKHPESGSITHIG